MKSIKVGNIQIRGDARGVITQKGDTIVSDGDKWVSLPTPTGDMTKVLTYDPAADCNIKWAVASGASLSPELIVSVSLSEATVGTTVIGDWRDIPYDTETTDVYDSFDTSTHRFTVPADGVYLFIVWGKCSLSSYGTSKLGIYRTDDAQANWWSDGGYYSSGPADCAFNITLPLAEDDEITGIYSGLNCNGINSAAMEIYKL